MCSEALFLPFIETFLTLTSPFLLFQSGLVPGVCGCSPGFVAGHRKHPDSLLRPPISANLPPQEEPGAPEIRHKPPGSELNWWVSQIQTRQPGGFCVTELKGFTFSGFFPWMRLEISALSQSTTWCKHCDEASHFCTSVKYPTNHNHYNMSRGCNLTDLLDVDLSCFYWRVWASTCCSFIVASWLSFLWGVSGLTLSGNKLRLCRRRSAHLCLDRCPCDAAENGCMDDFSRAFFVPAGSDISDFIHNIESQDIKVEMMKQSDYMAAAPHSAAINVTRSSKVTLILNRLNLITDIRLDETGAPPPTFNVSRCSCCSQSALCLRAAGSSNWELSV